MKYSSALLALLAISISSLSVAQDAAKSKAKADPSGTWRMEYDWQGTPMKDAFQLNLAKGGKVVGLLYRNDNKPIPIKNGKLDGDVLSYTVSGEYQGVKWSVDYKGKVKGDEIADGTAVVKWDGQSQEFPWRPERSVEMSDVVGTWQLRIDAGDSIFEPTLTIAKDGDKYKSSYKSEQVDEVAISKVRVEKNHLMFTIKLDFQGSELTVNYKGRPYGDSLKGTLDYEIDGNTGEGEFTGKRKKPAKKKGKKEKTSGKKE